MDVVDVDEKEERAQDSALVDSKEHRAGVRKCSVNKDAGCGPVERTQTSYGGYPGSQSQTS